MRFYDENKSLQENYFEAKKEIMKKIMEREAREQLKREITEEVLSSISVQLETGAARKEIEALQKTIENLLNNKGGRI